MANAIKFSGAATPIKFPVGGSVRLEATLTLDPANGNPVPVNGKSVTFATTTLGVKFDSATALTDNKGVANVQVSSDKAVAFDVTVTTAQMFGAPPAALKDTAKLEAVTVQLLPFSADWVRDKKHYGADTFSGTPEEAIKVPANVVTVKLQITDQAGKAPGFELPITIGTTPLDASGHAAIFQDGKLVPFSGNHYTVTAGKDGIATLQLVSSKTSIIGLAASAGGPTRTARVPFVTRGAPDGTLAAPSSRVINESGEIDVKEVTGTQFEVTVPENPKGKGGNVVYLIVNGDLYGAPKTLSEADAKDSTSFQVALNRIVNGDNRVSYVISDAAGNAILSQELDFTGVHADNSIDIQPPKRSRSLPAPTIDGLPEPSHEINEDFVANANGVKVVIPKYDSIAVGDEVVATFYLNGYHAGTDDKFGNEIPSTPAHAVTTEDIALPKGFPIAFEALNFWHYDAADTAPHHVGKFYVEYSVKTKSSGALSYSNILEGKIDTVPPGKV